MMHRLEQRGIAAEETDEIAARVPMRTFKLSEKGAREGGLEADLLTGFVFALMLYMTILLYGISVQRSILEDKNSRIVEILLSTVRPLQLMLGKVIGVGGVGLTQYAIWAAVAVAGSAYVKASNPAFANMATIAPLTLVFFVVYFVLGYLLYSAIYAAIGAMVNTDQEAQQMQMPVTMLLVIPMIFLQFILKDPDSTTSIVLSLVPFFTPILMMIRLTTATPPMWQLLLSVVIMLGSILACAAIAARIFRIGILMYGKRPTLPEIFRWIRVG
jgi:ABC-2 type transport system permease protein